MKMNQHLAAMMMMASMSDYGFTEQGSIGTERKPQPINPKKITPFKKHEGVLNMINDYKLIKQGKSKKGISKQNRIKNKINEWLESGMINNEDINEQNNKVQKL